MEIYERIRELRKKHLKMSMEAFGKRLGVSLDVISNIEKNRLAKPEQKLSLYKLICKEFNIREDWLLNGNEPMYEEADIFNLDEFIKSRDASKLEIEILKAYFALEPSIRKNALEQFKIKLANAVNNDPSLLVPDVPKDLEKLYPPVADKNENDNIG